MEVKHAIVIILFLAVSYMIWPRKKKAVKPLQWSDLIENDRLQIATGTTKVFGNHLAFVFVDIFGAFECSPRITLKQSFEEYCKARGLPYLEVVYKGIEEQARSKLPVQQQVYI